MRVQFTNEWPGEQPKAVDNREVHYWLDKGYPVNLICADDRVTTRIYSSALQHARREGYRISRLSNRRKDGTRRMLLEPYRT